MGHVVDRRTFLGTLTGGLLAASLAAEAQPAGKVYRIGMLETRSAALNAANVDAFRQGMRELGYKPDQNLEMVYRSSDGRDERFPALAAELVHLKVNLILTRGTPAALAAKSATGSIPVVMAASGDPIGSHIVTSLARPSGNITGLTIQSPELSGKRLELLKEAVPGLTRVAVLWDPTEPGRRELVKETDVAAPRLGLTIHMLEVRNGREIGNAFSAMTRERVGAVLVYGSSLLAAHRATIADLAVKRRLPAMSVAREWMDAGFVMSYGTSLNDMYRRAAFYVDKILKGAQPRDLPVEQPTKFELVINLKTAKTLGLMIPQSLLQRADQVIE